VALPSPRIFPASGHPPLRLAGIPAWLPTGLARRRAVGQVALSDPAATAESLRTAHERILAAGTEQEALIEALLTLTRGHAGIGVRHPFDLAQLAHQGRRRPEI
jgi:hypothetical protein